MEKGPYIGLIGSVIRMREHDQRPQKLRIEHQYGLWPDHPWSSRNIQQNAKFSYGEDHPQAQGKFLCPLRR